MLLSQPAVSALDPQPAINPSPHVLQPCGDSPQITPIGETGLFCKHRNQSIALRNSKSYQTLSCRQNLHYCLDVTVRGWA